MIDSTISVGDISLSIENPHEEFQEKVSIALNFIIEQNDISTSSINSLKLLLISILKKIKVLKNSGFSEECWEALIKSHDIGRNKLTSICLENNEEMQNEAFKSLIELLPYQVVLGKKPLFPDYHFGIILKTFIIYEGDTSNYLNFLNNLLTYEDISQNIWKALEIANCKLIESLSTHHVSNTLKIINSTEKPKGKECEEIGPLPHFCPAASRIASEKEIGTNIKRLWDRLISVDLPPKLMQSLLLTLYERLMPRMNKPIFLTDFFMTLLETGGPISLLALQGIFTLIQKYNMNYPDVYQKIYAMLNVEIFGTPYKARFYYLTDMFLSSSHLPESLVAGFIKKFARLSLLAPPVDVIIMMAFIVNLMVRHPGLKKLVHNPADITYESDPYNFIEKDPSLSRAIESSLWEVVIHQSHALPAVSSSAMFINNPLPATERDLSDLLEMTSEQMFTKEYKKKMKNPPVSFEKPTSLYAPNVRSGLSLWNFNS